MILYTRVLSQYIIYAVEKSMDDFVSVMEKEKVSIGTALALAKTMLYADEMQWLDFIADAKPEDPDDGTHFLNICKNRLGDKMSLIRIVSYYIESRQQEAICYLKNSAQCKDDLYITQSLLRNLIDFAKNERKILEPNQAKISACQQTINAADTNCNPKKITKLMEQYVYGQDEAVKQISLLAHTQIKRMQNPSLLIKKQNYMLMGPTGSGKSEIARTLNKILPMPVVILNCASAVPSG